MPACMHLLHNCLQARVTQHVAVPSYYLLDSILQVIAHTSQHFAAPSTCAHTHTHSLTLHHTASHDITLTVGPLNEDASNGEHEQGEPEDVQLVVLNVALEHLEVPEDASLGHVAPCCRNVDCASG